MAWAAPAPAVAPPPTAGHWGGQGQPAGVPEQWSPPTAEPAPGAWQSGGASVPPVEHAGYPGQPAPAARARRGWLGIVTLVLVGLLIAVTGLQAYQINRLDKQLADTGKRLETAQNGDGARLEGLETRADALEKQAGDVFNPEAIAAAVLPSVFRVRAGQFTGTAFAVGKPVTGGGAYLFTNYHVVEGVWDAGDREVFLERTGQRFPARIEKVDETNDIAQLKTDGKFAGLVTAPSPVKSGQQIVVVGAPLGLTDSVTTGVVSAFRKNENGAGEVIQFDAPINPGNSGGPVINAAKEVVGIATAKARDSEGIGLAVPIKTACDSFKIC